MKRAEVVFIASTEYDNLGIGYIGSVLKAEGFRSHVIDARKKRSEILKILKELSPEIIGFAIIFQYHLKVFIDLITLLRNEGIKCHFTAGGHYATLKTEEVYDYIPQLDSVVRFDGEQTMLELVSRILKGENWKEIRGIAYKDVDKLIYTELRPVITGLDVLPFPLRSRLKKYAFGLPFATILAGRGCTHNCSFCNTRKFYRLSGGPLKRTREPEMVAGEIDMLYRTRKCPVFLFTDDDFPVKKKNWVERFCIELERRKLDKKILWNICCRADEVDMEKFRLMKDHGLFLVFLGIEDGTDEGLKNMNKQVSSAMNLRSLDILRKLELGIDFGFLLFQPSSTFSSVRENLEFLRKIAGDGYMPVTFLKMMPYYDTKAERDLIREKRLKISGGFRDYDFTDSRMDKYYDFIINCFGEWLRAPDGLEARLNWARNYFLVYSGFFGKDNEYARLKRQMVRLTSESNIFLIETMSHLLYLFESESETIPGEFRSAVMARHDSYKIKAGQVMDELYNLALSRV